MSGSCDHSGFHSGVGRLVHELQAIRFVLVCDGCGEEMREVHVEDYAFARDDERNGPGTGRRAA